MNNAGALLFFSILPVLILLTIIYYKDKSKEPLLFLLVFFGLGVLSCYLVLKVSDLMRLALPFMNLSTKEMNIGQILIYSFLVVALTEEICKWIMVYAVGYYSKEFEELYDIIVYAVFVSLGFAFYENIAYVFYLGNLQTAFFRAISAVPGHACYAITMGYYLSLAKQCHYKKRKDLEKRNIILSILIPTVLHGVYDFCLMLNMRSFLYIFVVFVIVLFYITFKRLKELSELNGKIRHKKEFCPKCGHKITEKEYCENCGTKL